ncbi:MAG TPA: choice-of-anchor D domain-containing protein [Methylomirabilota bacterium]|nr:choice-of-anchor D domain-containing protein [Methylomirabilota bacterium]
MRLGHSLAHSLGLFFLLSSFFATPILAQTSQPYLFAKVPPSATQPNAGMVSFFRSDSTGALTLLSDSLSTFNDGCVPSALDPKGRFLYSLCGDGASMYSLDPSTAAVTEVPNAPFAASQLAGYISQLIVAENSGNYVYVVKENASATDLTRNFYIDAFQVVAAVPTLTPVSSQQIDLVGAGSVIADPLGRALIFFVDQRNSSADANPNAVLAVITFDPVTGLANFDSTSGQVLGQNERAMAISPTGNYLALTYGVSGATLVSYAIAQSSFTLNSAGNYFLGPDLTPAGPYNIGAALFFNPGGQILYVQSAPADFTGGGLPFQLFDPSDYLILPASPLSLSEAAFLDALPDPQGPFVFSSASNGGISAYYVDPVSGRASQPNSVSAPFAPQLGAIAPVLASFGPSGGQGTSGPALSVSRPSLTFSQLTAGQSSAPQYVTLKNVGNEVVNLTSLSLTGANSSDFRLANNCNPSALAANQSCTLSVVYSPATAGTSNASILIASNAPQSPQLVALSGTAIAPVSQVKLDPASIVFPSTTEGTTSNPMVLTLTNEGGASLHISSAVIGGNNVPDFSFAPTNCTGTINAGANCTLSVTFTPLAAGLRTATWTVTDDAPGSPRVVSISGTGVPAAQIGAASGGSTSATVTAGQSAQFSLQATPGNGFTGSLAFTCSEVPFGATCTPPASVSITSGNTAPFTVSVSTLGAAVVPPLSFPVSNIPLRPTPWLFMAVLAALAAFLLWAHSSKSLARISRATTVASAVLSLCLILSGIGCGGAGNSGNSTPPTSPAEQTVATPTILPAGGTFSVSQSVSITDSTPGATTHYTTDGSIPTASSPVYSAPFSLTSAATIKAMATATGYNNSAIVSSAFAFRTPSGSYSVTVNVTATPAGTTKSLPITPVVLTLIVN